MVFKLRTRCITGASHEKMGSSRVQCPQYGNGGGGRERRKESVKNEAADAGRV